MMNLNSLKQGADWMTADEKALCKEFVTGMRKVFRRQGVTETPLLAIRMNAVIATYIQTRRLEAFLAAEAEQEQQAEWNQQASREQSGQPSRKQPKEGANEQAQARNDQQKQGWNEGEANAAATGKHAPAPKAGRQARADAVSIIESIGKAWERIGKAMKDLEAQYAKTGTPIVMGIADEMKPIIEKAGNFLDEALVPTRPSNRPGAPIPAQLGPEKGKKA